MDCGFALSVGCLHVGVTKKAFSELIFKGILVTTVSPDFWHQSEKLLKWLTPFCTPPANCGFTIGLT